MSPPPFTIPILQKPLFAFHLNHPMSSPKISQTHPLAKHHRSYPSYPIQIHKSKKSAIICMLTTTNLILQLSGQQLVYRQSMNTTQKVYSLWLSPPFSWQALQCQISQEWKQCSYMNMHFISYVTTTIDFESIHPFVITYIMSLCDIAIKQQHQFLWKGTSQITSQYLFKI